jgi:hypothetical protein
LSYGPTPPAAPDEFERVLNAAAVASHEISHSDFFYRQLAIHMAKEATSDFRRAGGPHDLDGTAAIQAFLRHEQEMGRLQRNEIVVHGSGYRVKANVHSCPYEGSCKGNMKALGEVPQCLRAIMLIEAISAKIPQRPPMTYDLAPGLVDGKGPTCEVQLRPAGVPDVTSAPSPAGR